MNGNDLRSAGEALADSNGSSSSSSSTTTPNMDAPIVQYLPMVAIAFDELVSLRFTGDVKADQNILCMDDGGMDDAVEITVTNPTVEYGDIYHNTDGDEYADYKVVNTDEDITDEDTEVQYDENDDPFEAVTGITYYDGMGSYSGEPVDALDEDVIRLQASGREGIRLIRQLDACGALYAGDHEADEEYTSMGPIESPPQRIIDDDDRDDPSRVVRTLVARTDVLDDPRIFSYFGDGGQNGNKPKNVDVFDGPIMEDGDVQEQNILAPSEDTDAPIDDQFVRYRWDSYESDTDADTSSDSDDDDSGNGAGAWGNGTDENVTFDDLSSQDQSYVDEGVDTITEEFGASSVSDAFDDFSQTYEMHVEQDHVSGEVDASTMETIIDAKIDA